MSLKHITTSWMADRFVEVGENPKYRQKWISDYNFYKAVESYEYGVPGDEEQKKLDKFNLKNFTRAISQPKRFGGSFNNFDGSHQGVLCHENHAKCPDTGRRKSCYYYLTDPGTPVKKPKVSSIFAHEVILVSTRHVGRKEQEDDVDVEEEPETEEPEPKRLKLPEEVHRHTAWSSTEYNSLFNPTEKESVTECLERRMEDLAHVNRGDSYWRDIIDNYDQYDICTKGHIFFIRNKCVLLAMAYKNALEFMGDFSKTWYQCCEKAIRDCCDVGFNKIKNARTVMLWNQWFRKHESFPCPTTKKLQEPILFQVFPSTKKDIMEWIYENMADLTCNNVRQFLIHSVLPDLNANKDELNAEQLYLLPMLIEKPPSETTVWRWLKVLGFVYDLRKKTFYVDGHEKAEQRFTRLLFSKKYLTELEPHMHRWVPLTMGEARDMVNSGAMDEKWLLAGYKYQDEDDEERIEFHVDTNDFLHKYASDMYLFGGKPSVRRDKDKRRNPLVILGQDECIFNQYMMKPKNWIDTISGRRPLLPKSQGATLMVSAFQCREFGFGMELSEDDLFKINQKRLGTKYCDPAAAIEVTQTSEKQRLLESPFVRYIDVGENREGYWDYNHMVVQLEDVVDCLQVMRPDFDYLLLFDHSSGHAKKRIGGLDANKMKVYHGGVQPIMQDSTILEEDGYLGPFQRILEMGDTQSFVFKEGDAGPFYLQDLPEDEFERRKQTQYEEEDGTLIDKTKQDLADELSQGQIVKIDPSKKRLTELQSLAQARGIDSLKPKVKKVEGWFGAPKGMLQVLWERGWVDEPNFSEYRKISTDNNGEVIDDRSLVILMASCLDFANEISQLQAIGEKMGSEIMLTPKFHCEMAGEGIEYAWGVSKSIYRSMKLADKKSLSGFHNLVKNRCLSCRAIPIESVRRFSHRARSYICAYYEYETTHANGIESTNRENGANEAVLPSLNYSLIQKMQRKFKVHRGALDFDKSFILSKVVEF
jgi:hypothetical protein